MNGIIDFTKSWTGIGNGITTTEAKMKATDWQEDDLAWNGYKLVRVEKKIEGCEIETYLIVAIADKECKTAWGADALSIPTPSQLLMEYNGHKCLIWETENYDITVRYGFFDIQFQHYSSGNRYNTRFLVPKELMAVCISSSQMARHYPSGIEYPEGGE
jgi:hypothetical protein